VITDVAGVLVGHHQRIEPGWATGTTVILFPPGTTGAVDGRGGAPGTRETDLLLPENLVQHVNAVCLSGGSAYGLAAADGVMRWLSERERGFPVGAAPHEVVPIVPAAVIFDLPRSEWGNRPDASFGYQACEAAGVEVAQGCVGAGTGAKVGSLKGGVGTASTVVDGVTVGALAAVNAAGNPIDPSSGDPITAPATDPGTPLNTTIGVVAVDATLSKAECRRLAMSAHDGLARAIRPAHTMFDGDTIFAAATGATDLPADPLARAIAVNTLCAAAADVFGTAIWNGIRAATSLAGLPAHRDVSHPETPPTTP
jgi:L-aminopeptidase/D-esterase-like protein